MYLIHSEQRVQWVQLHGLVLELEMMNFSNNHLIYKEVAVLLSIKFYSLKAYKDTWALALREQTDARLMQLSKE